MWLSIIKNNKNPLKLTSHKLFLKTEPLILDKTTECLIIHKKPESFIQKTSLTVKNNLSINFDFKLVERGKTITQVINNSGSIWLAASNINSEYELYLQKSMIRDVYDMYKKFTEHSQKKTSILGNRESAYDKQIDHFGNVMFQKFVNYINRQIIYESVPRTQIIIRPQERATVMPEAERSFTEESRLHVQKTVETDSRTDRTEVFNTVNQLNIENVMERVYKKLEDRLRHEQFKKGF